MPEPTTYTQEEIKAILPYLTDEERAELDSLLAPVASSGVLEGWRAWAGDTLVGALEACANAKTLIEAEQAKILPLIEQASDDVERRAREWQRDLVGWQLTRAAEIAEQRIAYFKELKDFDAEDKKCGDDIFHWFRFYTWGYDPRPDSPLSIVPFALFDQPPFDDQVKLVNWLEDLAFTRRTSGVCEKPREVGATDIVRSWLIHRWRWKDGFSALLTSRNQDEVDKMGNLSTMFERIRFQLRHLPPAQLPKGFDWRTHATYMRLINPANNATLIGSAPTPDVGRQGRYTVAVIDEGASLDESKGGYSQHTSLSQSTRSQFWISSVKGKLNKFAELSHDGRTPKLTLEWRNHPWKDGRWYNALPYGYLGAAMSDEQIAQEIDCNYEASQPGKVIKNCREEYSFITWDELVEGFEAYGLGYHFKQADGRFKIPSAWNWGRVSDYGMSARQEDDTHIWAYSLFARPQQAFPFTDSLFFFYSLPIEPIGASELEAFKFYSQLERNLGLRSGKDFTRKPSVNDMSHEAKDPKDVLLTQCGDYWHLPDLDFFKGVSKLRFHFELTDNHKPNPFRPELMGRSRIYFVAPSSEYQLAKHERDSRWFVTASKSQYGFKRLRSEIQSWHFPPEERGKPVQKMRPAPVFDDIITTVRYGLARWGVASAALTYAQKVQALIPDKYKRATLASNPSPAHEMSVSFQEARAKSMVKSTIRSWDYLGNEIGAESEDEK